MKERAALHKNAHEAECGINRGRFVHINLYEKSGAEALQACVNGMARLALGFP